MIPSAMHFWPTLLRFSCPGALEWAQNKGTGPPVQGLFSPSSAPRAPGNAPRGLQDASKRPPRGPQVGMIFPSCAQDAPRRVQEASKRPQDAAQRLRDAAGTSPGRARDPRNSAFSLGFCKFFGDSAGIRPRRPEDAPRPPGNAPRTPREPPQGPPRAPQGPSREPPRPPRHPPGISRGPPQDSLRD